MTIIYDIQYFTKLNVIPSQFTSTLMATFKDVPIPIRNSYV